jgi:hypothetical protein
MDTRFKILLSLSCYYSSIPICLVRPGDITFKGIDIIKL